MVAVDTGLGDAQIDYERLIAESVVQVAERRSSGSGVTLPELAVR